MHEDLRKFIENKIKDNIKHKDDIISDIGIVIYNGYYDYSVYFTNNSKNLYTVGSIKISDFNKQLRLEKLKKLKI